MTRGAALAPLRERNVRWYFLAQAVNQAGSYMNSVALAFAVLEVSDSPSALGTVLAAHGITMVLFMLAGGVIADRFGRTLTIQISNAGAGLTQLAIAVLVISGSAQLGWLIALTAVNGVFAAANLPALASLVPQLVPHDHLQQTNALISLQRNALRIIGPAAAGVIVVTAGAGWALAFDGATYLLSAAIFVLVRLPPRPPPEDSSSMLAQLRDGWTFVRSTTWFGVSVAAFMVINAVAAGALLTLGPVLSARTSIGESGWGLIVAAESAGYLLGALVFLRVRLERPLFWGMVGMSLAGLPLIALGAAPHLGLALAASFIAGAGMEVFSIGWAVTMQEHVPPAMLSRAYSYDALGSFVAMPVGQLAAGPISHSFGVRPTMLVSGVVLAALCLLTLCWRSIRDLPRVPSHGPPARPETT